MAQIFLTPGINVYKHILHNFFPKKSFQVFVLMQFDPGMEYRPDWGSTKVPIKG